MYEITYQIWSVDQDRWTQEKAVVRADSGSAAVEKLLAANPTMRYSDIYTVTSRDIVYI
jgi:hypothetical protein